jgi:Trk K+ transport system NAD-binding subunit
MPLLFNLIQPPTAKEAGYATRLIYGWDNSLARNVAQQLKAHGEQVKIINTSPKDEESILAEGCEPFLIAHLKTAGDDIDTAIILSSDDEKNLEISRKVQNAGISHVIALVNEPGNLETFKRSGVQVFSPALYRSSMITLMARNPSIFNLLSSTNDDQNLMELTVRNSILAGQRVRDLILPGDSLILSIKRGEEILIPHGSTRLELDDQISIFVHNNDTFKVVDLFQHPVSQRNQQVK